jgi:hypothetical protein
MNKQFKSIVQFYIVIFVVSFISDIILNDLSKTNFSEIITTIKPYFANKTIVESGVYAGLTIISALIPTMFTFRLFLGKGKWVPHTIRGLITMLVIAYPIGYIYDMLIDKFQVFGNDLDVYYKKAGAGFWGAVSFEFAIFVTYIIVNVLFRC